ncbi:hypothetical protein [Dyella koreensis]|uniref:Uncharacterized protein n=1 Tax=Dyella koreensis TaxID=311235 RepID=A0ABW8K857_9GAMM
MNVQLSRSGIGHSAATGASATAVSPIANGVSKDKPSMAGQCGAAPVSRTAFAARQEQLNRQITHAQRTTRFLEQALTAFGELKTTLSQSVAGRHGARDVLQETLGRAQAQWSTRHAATGGALAQDLSFHEDGSARQDFHIRAMDLQSLHNERPELLTVYPRGTGKPPVSLLIDGAHRSAREWVRRLDHTLAASGISATLAEDNEPTFSTLESRWPELRDHLMIQGAGHRFPAGRPSRATAEIVPPFIDPTSWQIDDTAGQRAALRGVVQAIDRLQRTRDSLDRLLAETDSDMRHDRAALAEDAKHAAPAFGEALEKTSDFQRFATIGATLRGLSEQRVRAVSV